MLLSTVRKSKAQLYNRLNSIKFKKWRMILLFLTAFLVTVTFLRFMPPRLTTTSLIFNNKYLCNSNQRMLDRLTATEINQRSIVIVVLSSRKNFMNRNVIRNTWGSVRSVNNITILAVAFMLGSLEGPEDEKTDLSLLETEMIQFGDLVMGDFVDTYRNLSRKAIMAYEWLTSFCQEAQIVVKTDDDVLVNIFKLTEELDAFTPTEVSSSNFWCAIHFSEDVIKREDSIYHVSSEEFAGDIFPNHCAGVGYVTPMGVIHRILDEISRSFLGRICTHEDVFMTGIVPEKINANNSTENVPIGHINRMIEWITYALENKEGDDTQFLVEFLQQPIDDIIDFGKFRKRFGTHIFYLIDHGPDFEERYKKLWQIIKKTFY